MLAEMSWQILQFHAQIQKFPDPWLAHIEAGVTELHLERVGFVFVFEMAYEAGQTIERFGIEPEYFPDFARCRPAAIGNDIGRHRGAERAVSLVNILNRAFALIAAGQIEIDVGPFTAFF